MQEMWVRFLCQEDLLEEEMATYSSVLAWRIPGTGEPGGLPSMGSHRVGHNWSNLAVLGDNQPYLHTEIKVTLIGAHPPGEYCYHPAVEKIQSNHRKSCFLGANEEMQRHRLEKKITIPYDITYTWNLKYGTNQHIYGTETDSQIERLVASGGGG